MKKHTQPIDLSPVKQEILSPAEFLRLSKERPHAIARSRFVPPRLGDHGYGAFEVQYGIPQLRAHTEPA